MTGGVVAFILLAGVCISEHPSSSLMTHESIDYNQLLLGRASLPVGDVTQTSKSESTDPIDRSKE